MFLTKGEASFALGEVDFLLPGLSLALGSEDGEEAGGDVSDDRAVWVLYQEDYGGHRMVLFLDQVWVARPVRALHVNEGGEDGVFLEFRHEFFFGVGASGFVITSDGLGWDVVHSNLRPYCVLSKRGALSSKGEEVHNGG